MAKNRYSIVNSEDPGRGISVPPVVIVKYRLRMNLEHWLLDHRLSRFWLLYWNETPGAKLIFQDKTVEMFPGTVVLIPPFTLVSAEVNAPFIHNFIEFSAGFPFEGTFPQVFVFSDQNNIFVKSYPVTQEHLAMFLYSLVYRFLSSIPVIASGKNQLSSLDPRILKAIEYLDRISTLHYSAAKLSKEINLSVPRALHLFKEQTGMTPREYLQRKRLELVWQLLNKTQLSIAEIADQTGFVDRSHMTRAFRSFTGKTPVQMRRELHSSKMPFLPCPL